MLEPLYAALPGRLPPLYEQLILSYRWSDAELPSLRLLGNPPGEGLTMLLASLRYDRILWDTLLPAGFVPFGRGGRGNYDPVCFDRRHRQKNGDCRVVQMDHEEILCFSRIGEVSEIAGSFRHLVLATIEAGGKDLNK